MKPQTHATHRPNGQSTVSGVVRQVVAQMHGVFHVSEVKREVWQIKPEANAVTVSTALHNMVHKYGELVSPSNQHYQRKVFAA